MPGRRLEAFGLQALRQCRRWRARGPPVRRRQCDALRCGTGLQRGVEVRIVGWRTRWFAGFVPASRPRTVTPRLARHRRWPRHALVGQTAVKRTAIHALRRRIVMRRGRSWRRQRLPLLLSTRLHRGQIARARWRWRWRTALRLRWHGRRRWPTRRRAAEAGAAAQAEHCKQRTDGNGGGACLDHRESPWLDGAHMRTARIWQWRDAPAWSGRALHCDMSCICRCAPIAGVRGHAACKAWSRASTARCMQYA